VGGDIIGKRGKELGETMMKTSEKALFTRRLERNWVLWAMKKSLENEHTLELF